VIGGIGLSAFLVRRSLLSMVTQWNDPELEKLHAAWQRRGELLVTAGIAALFTWLAATLPSEAQTHVEVWPIVLVTGVLVALGVYMIAAAETERAWLPRRDSIRATALNRGLGEMMERSNARSDLRRDVTVRLADDRPAPIAPPASYQAAAVKAALPLIAQTGSDFDIRVLDTVLMLMERKREPIYEPLHAVSCEAGLAELLAEGAITQIDRLTFRISDYPINEEGSLTADAVDEEPNGSGDPH
jgi:hypothetical protein